MNQPKEPEFLLPKTLSASSLSNWEECQAKFKAVNIDHIPEFGDKNAAKVGTTVHYALEHFVRATCMEKTHSWTGIDANGGKVAGGLEYLLELLFEGYKETFGSANKRTEFWKDALALTEKWYARTDLSGWTIDNVEEKKRTPIGETGILLTYIYDRVQRMVDEDGRRILKVVDYKGLDRDTEIPTPTGWTTMAKLEKGDEVLGGDGTPCRVVHKSEIHHRDCYRLTFDDGTSIVCDDEHRWAVRLGKTPGKYQYAVMTPLELLERGLSSGKQRDVAIEHQAVELPAADLPIDPYVFGAWIGDGNAQHGGICKPLPALFEEIEGRGYRVGKLMSDGITRTVHGIRGHLEALGVRGNKHLPAAYLRASYRQRLDLLRGIMDTDGHWNPIRQRAVLNTTNRGYAEQVYELVVSLGWTANIFETTAVGFGREWDAYQLWFTPTGEDIFLARPPEDYRPESVRPFRRIIRSIEKVETVPTQCIEVDSPDHCFLAGRQMVKTHNTERRTYAHEELRDKLQARIYAVTAAIEYRDWQPDEIWVELDMLRYTPVGVLFTREDNEETWDYLLESAHLIMGTREDLVTTTVGGGCGYCPIKASCKSVQKNIEGGGVMSLTLDEMVEMHARVSGQAKGLDVLAKEIEERLLAHADHEGVEQFKVESGRTVKIAQGGQRAVSDVSEVADIIGPELMKMFGKIGVGDLDKLLDSEQLTTEQKVRIRRLIIRKPTKTSVKVSAIPAVKKKVKG